MIFNFKLKTVLHFIFLIFWSFYIFLGFSSIDFGYHWDENYQFLSFFNTLSTKTIDPNYYVYGPVTYYFVSFFSFIKLITFNIDYIPDIISQHRLNPGAPDKVILNDLKIFCRGILFFSNSIFMILMYRVCRNLNFPRYLSYLPVILMFSSFQIFYHAKWIAPDIIFFQLTILYIYVWSKKFPINKKIIFLTIISALITLTKYYGGIFFIFTIISNCNSFNYNSLVKIITGYIVAIYLIFPQIILKPIDVFRPIIGELLHYSVNGHGPYNSLGFIDSYTTIFIFLFDSNNAHFIFSIFLLLLFFYALYSNYNLKNTLSHLIIFTLVIIIYFALQKVIIVRNYLFLYPLVFLIIVDGINRLPYKHKVKKIVSYTVLIICFLNFGKIHNKVNNSINFNKESIVAGINNLLDDSKNIIVSKEVYDVIKDSFKYSVPEKDEKFDYYIDIFGLNQTVWNMYYEIKDSIPRPYQKGNYIRPIYNNSYPLSNKRKSLDVIIGNQSDVDISYYPTWMSGRFNKEGKLVKIKNDKISKVFYDIKKGYLITKSL